MELHDPALLSALRTQRDDLLVRLAQIEGPADEAGRKAVESRLQQLQAFVTTVREVLPDPAGLADRCEALRQALSEREDGAARAAPAQALREHVNQMIFACATAGPAPTEIERKFLLSALPAHMPAARTSVIEQGWLPGAHPRERLRVRSVEGGAPVYYRTLKGGRGVTRIEIEDEIEAPLFDALWPLTAGCRVRKRRYVIPVGAHVWEVDEFLDRDGLWLAEIELDAEDEAYETPPWLQAVIAREVSDEPGFSNLDLAL